MVFIGKFWLVWALLVTFGQSCHFGFFDNLIHRESGCLDSTGSWRTIIGISPVPVPGGVLKTFSAMVFEPLFTNYHFAEYPYPPFRWQGPKVVRCLLKHVRSVRMFVVHIRGDFCLDREDKQPPPSPSQCVVRQEEVTELHLSCRLHFVLQVIFCLARHSLQAIAAKWV